MPACGKLYAAERAIGDYLITCKRGRPPEGDPPGGSSFGGTVSFLFVATTCAGNEADVWNESPWPVSLAKIPPTELIGTEISRDTPANLAENCSRSLPILRLRVASGLTFSTISPFLTYSIGTLVVSSTLTAMYGVRPLSQHHSKIARIRYGVVDVSFTFASLSRKR